MTGRFGAPSILIFLLLFISTAIADPYPPLWSNGAGAAIHYDPVAWPTEPANPQNCGTNCGDWKPYTRFQQPMNDPRTRDPSNGGTSPQSYVNVTSSCSDKARPSIYYYLHRGATQADDVLMFRWRVEAAAHNYATGPSAGSYGSSNPWSSALWTVLFDVDGSGYRSLAAHLDGSSGAPAKPVDLLVGIWGESANHSLDYINDPKVHLLGHNPTGYVGAGGKILNFNNSLTPTENWPNGANETTWDYGSTRARLVSTSSCTEYFIDYQIPIALLDASSLNGPKITRSTPIAMLFCTANSLNNPFQKDCAVNKNWLADAGKTAPFGDYLSFNQTEPYSQPIISRVDATAPTACPGTYGLSATVQDTLALNSGVVTTSVQAVDFYYWFDADGDGTANDAGSEWVKITPAGVLVAGTLNRWATQWDASSLPKGKYLVGAQALDDSARLDDDMVPIGINNRTFSYLSGDAANQLFINNSWVTGQAGSFPGHSPAITPGAGENWYGNPDVTGQQLALIGTAINACGVAPTLTASVSDSQAVAGTSVTYQLNVTNPATNANSITLNQLSFALPAGFSYQSGTSLGTAGIGNANPVQNGQQLVWGFAPVTLAPGATAQLDFSVTVSSTAGTYNASAEATTSFGAVTAGPVAVAVDAGRVGLTAVPDTYLLPADGTTPVTVTFNYANESLFALTSGSLVLTLPAGVNYGSCSGGSQCSVVGSTLTWTLGTLDPAEAGTASLTLSVPSNWTTSSLTLTGTLTALAPDGATVTRSAATTVAISGYVQVTPASFTLTKAANATRIAPAANVTYTLTYQNTGGTSAANVVLTDTLPDGMTYSSVTGGGSHSSGVVTWNLGTVAAGASGSVTVTAIAASSPFTFANPTTNTASLNWTGGTAVSAQAKVGITGDYCSAVFYFRQGADNNLATVRPASQTKPTAGSAYTTTLSNISDNTFESYTTEVNQVVFEQSAGLGSALDISGQSLTINYYLSAAQGGGRSQVILRNHTKNTTIATSGELNITTGTGSWYNFTATVPASTTIDAGDKLRWYFQFRASGGKDITFHYDSATINSRSSFCTATSPALLSLTASPSVGSVTEAATPTITYTLNYANSGGTTATGVALAGNLPSGFTNCQYSTNNSTWAACSGGTTHSFALGSLAAAASGTVYVRGTVPAGTTAGNTLTAAPVISGTSITSATASAQTQVVAAPAGTPALTLLLSASPTVAVPGDSVVYTVKVINTGSGNASGVTITNTLPVTSYFTYSSCTGGCNHNTGVLSWNTGSLAAGASQTYIYTMVVGSSGLAAGITAVTDDLTGSGNSGLSATSNAVVVNLNGNPALTGTLMASPNTGLAPGDTIVYSLNITNAGNAQAEGVAVQVPIPTHTLYASGATTSTGTVVFDTVNNRLLFSLGTMAAGASATLGYSVVIGSLDSGPTIIQGSATAAADNAAQQTFTANASAQADPQLELTQGASGSGAYPSALVTAASSGTTVYVDRTDRFQLGQLVRIGVTVARIQSYGASSMTVDTPVTANPGDAVVGAFTLTLGYRNNGNATATSVTLTELIPAGMEFYAADGSPQAAPAQGMDGTVSWNIGTLTAGGSGTRQIQVIPAGTAGTYTHQANLSAGNATPVAANTDVIIGGLSVAKTTTTPLVSASGIAHYRIVIANSLATPVSGVTLTDLLPQGFSYRTGTASVDGTPQEPTFDAADIAFQQPVWANLVVGAATELVVEFDADVASDAGAATYQNQVDVTAGGGVGIQPFDAFATTAEDVTVLAANAGVISGYVFFRDQATGNLFDPTADAPLAGVRVELYQTGADCSDPYDALCSVAYTDSNGYYQQVLATGTWRVNVVAGTGDLDNSWPLEVGDNDTDVTVASQLATRDDTGFALANSSSSASSVPAVSSTAASSEQSSSTASSSGIASSASASEVSSSAPSSAVAASSVASVASSLAVSSIAASSEQSSVAVSSIAPSSAVATSSVASVASSLAASSIAASSEQSSVAVSSIAPSSAIAASSVASVASSLAVSSIAASSEQSSVAVSSNAPSSAMAASSVASVASSVAMSSIAASSEQSSIAVSSSALSSAVGASSVASVASSAAVSSSLMSSVAQVSSASQSSAAAFLVTPQVGEGGSVTPADAQSVAQGQQVTFTVTPTEGYEVSGVTSDCGGSLQGLVYTTAPVNTHCSVEFLFRRPLVAVDLAGQPFTGTEMSRGGESSFRVLGGKGQIRTSASAMHAGNLTLMGSESLEEFLANQGATLATSGERSYRFIGNRAGIYLITFEDEQGQRAELEFVVKPLVAFASSRQLGTAGQPINLIAVLDDDPGIYPVSVTYRVDNPNLAENLTEQGQFVFDGARQAQRLLTPVSNSGQLLFTLQPDGSNGVDLGSLIQHRIDLQSAATIPLSLDLSVDQSGNREWVVERGKGTVRLISSLSGNSYSYNWSGSNTALGIGQAGTGIANVNPTLLNGIYSVQLQVTELAAPNRQALATGRLRVVDAIPAGYESMLVTDNQSNVARLPICIEGGMNRVGACKDVLQGVFMTTLAPYKIILGSSSDLASWRDQEFALSMEAGDIRDTAGQPIANATDTQYDHLGYTIDFEIHQLEFAGQSVPIVVPLKPGLVIPADSVWRKYTANGGWRNFVEDGANQIASAPGDGTGNCPWPGDLAWRGGLNMGDTCVRLIVQDGGPNDQDGLADTVVRDPGTLAIKTKNTATPVTVQTVAKGSGGGAIADLLLVMMLLLFVARYRAALLSMKAIHLHQSDDAPRRNRCDE
ncbi:MAG TPA: hypothetical protein VL995_11720 [Cellvibrio sp.]|nr:hypothetical protein [Cellvibrio sp.]